MKEAVSTLIYAAPRTEIKELMEIRNQFAAKFGQDFVESAMDNKDLAVNQRVMFKLDVKVPEPYLCIDYLREIAKENGIEWDDSNVVTDVDVHNQQMPSNPGIQTFSIPTSEPIQHNQPFQTQAPLTTSTFSNSTTKADTREFGEETISPTTLRARQKPKTFKMDSNESKIHFE